MGRYATIMRMVNRLAGTERPSVSELRWRNSQEWLGVSIAEAHAGVSINDLTDERLLDELSGNAVLNGTPVTVKA